MRTARLPVLRATAFISVAALALHELRYLFGYGDGASQALASQGHGYLPLAAALAGVLASVAGAQVAVRILRALRQGRGDEGPLRLRSAWPWASLALVLIFVGQESLEGVLSSGHPAGLAAVTANGGLVALPLALVLGGLVALGLRGTGLVVQAAARRGRRARRRPRLRRPRLPQRVRPAGAGVLALNLAGRAPPARG